MMHHSLKKDKIIFSLYVQHVKRVYNTSPRLFQFHQLLPADMNGPNRLHVDIRVQAIMCKHYCYYIP